MNSGRYLHTVIGSAVGIV